MSDYPLITAEDLPVSPSLEATDLMLLFGDGVAKQAALSAFVDFMRNNLELSEGSVYLGAHANDASASASVGGLPSDGQLYWNSTESQMRVWDNSVWQVFSGVADGSVTKPKLAPDAIPPLFPTSVGITSTNIWSGIAAFQTLGYAAGGDGGRALYKRVGSEPSHSGKRQSADGGWWALAEPIVSPHMFGAKGDGVSDDTTAVINAVAVALASDLELYWPGGEYITTGNIPDFHSVRHRGPGRIKRGADVFSISIAYFESNRFYVSTTGSDTNDGLSSEQPFATVQAAANALRNYGLLDGIWRIVCAAGTYQPGDFTTLPTIRSRNYIYIEGPDVGGHPNVPTAIFDGEGAAFSCFVAAETSYLFRDVKLVGWKQNAGGGIINSDGFTYLWNVHTDDCEYSAKASGGRIRVRGGIFENGESGIVPISGASYTVGYLASDLASGPIFRNMSQAGVYPAEVSAGHVDWATFEGCSYGIDNFYSRCHALKCHFDGNVYPWRNRGQFYPNGCTFGSNQVPPSNFMGGVDVVMHGEAASPSARVAVAQTVITHTGTTALTVVSTPWTIPANWFLGNNKKIKIIISGTFTTVTGAVQLGYALNGTSMLTLQPPGTPNGLPFKAIFELSARTKDAHVAVGELLTNADPRIGSLDRGFTMTSGATLGVNVQLAAAGDIVTIRQVEVYVEG